MGNLRKGRVKMKNLILTILISLCLATPAIGTEYGPTIPTLPEGGILYYADTIDCNPEDYEAEDPHFFIALGYIWEDDDPIMFSVQFYRNDYVTESGLTNPSVVIYGDGGSETTVFVRIGETVTRYESFPDFMEAYSRSVCNIPREEI